MARLTAVAMCAFVPAVAQQVGEVKENHNLPLPIARCTLTGGCTNEETKVTMDANWRWVHEKKGYTSCYEGSSWDAAACSDGEECASNCAIEGVAEEDWSKTYGISKTTGGVRVQFKTGSNVGSRFYMLDPSNMYKQFKLLNREITFDVDVSTLPCGMNGAVYFSEMAADGEQGSRNAAGAAYGTGYCDAQCPEDVKFSFGEVNSEGWHTTSTGRTLGKYGSCCSEMDLWEANKMATAFTAHPCAVDKPYRCQGAECKTICDMPGCDYNSYRMGDHLFYGPGEKYTLNSLKPFTLVTQFITNDNTDDGDLVEVRRFYVQNGKKIENSKAKLNGLQNQTGLTDKSCALDKETFGEEDTLAKFGGMKQMGAAIGRGMTLVLSLWDDGASKMHWLDATVDGNPEAPGVVRGPCSAEAGDPSVVRGQHADSYVDYYNFKYGEIGSTTLGSSPTPFVPSPAPVAPIAPIAPESPSSGKCCYGGCSGGTCKDSANWCSKSKSNCEGPCSGQWCTGSAVLSEVKRHRQLRGKESVLMQKLFGLSKSKKSSVEL